MEPREGCGVSGGAGGNRERGRRNNAASPHSERPLNHFFRQFAQRTSQLMGSPWSFMAALVIIFGWAVTGPMFHFSDTWQLIINTSTTIITFLMVFLIQNTQNRDAQAMHLKLDELLRAVNSARTGLVELQDLPDEAIEELRAEFHALAEAEWTTGLDGTAKCEKVADSPSRSA